MKDQKLDPLDYVKLAWLLLDHMQEKGYITIPKGMAYSIGPITQVLTEMLKVAPASPGVYYLAGARVLSADLIAYDMPGVYAIADMGSASGVDQDDTLHYVTERVVSQACTFLMRLANQLNDILDEIPELASTRVAG